MMGPPPPERPPSGDMSVRLVFRATELEEQLKLARARVRVLERTVETQHEQREKDMETQWQLQETAEEARVALRAAEAAAREREAALREKVNG